MTQLNQITQQNASSSEELAATDEEMSSQAEQLQQSMSFFKLESGTGGTVSSARKPATQKHIQVAHAKSAGSKPAPKAMAGISDELEFVKF